MHIVYILFFKGHTLIWYNSLHYFSGCSIVLQNHPSYLLKQFWHMLIMLVIFGLQYTTLRILLDVHMVTWTLGTKCPLCYIVTFNNVSLHQQMEFAQLSWYRCSNFPVLIIKRENLFVTLETAVDKTQLASSLLNKYIQFRILKTILLEVVNNTLVKLSI